MNALAMFIRFDPFIVPLVPFLMFLTFVVAGPILVAIALVLTMRRSTRRVGTIMLASGGAGFVCLAVAAALRVWSKTQHFVSVGTALAFGLAGVSAFVAAAMLIHFRTPSGLTKR